MTPLALSILEQVPVFRGQAPATAIREAVDLAIATEALGYRRYWVAEHHDDPSRGCASPEVLSSFIAARTSTIRVGAGCVLLPMSSPNRVAAQWTLLNSLAPGRVDVGIGRGMAPASSGSSDHADPFPSQVAQLVAKFAGFDGEGENAPLPWLMGSGERGALTAAFLGLPFAFAQFAHDRARPDITTRYISEFRPGPICTKPTLVIAVRVNCADTEGEAVRQSLAIWLPVLTARRIGTPWGYATYPSDGDINDYSIGYEQRTAMVANPFLSVTGTPDTVVTTLRRLTDVYGTEDIALTTTCPDYWQRVRTFALVAEHIADSQTAQKWDKGRSA